MAITKKIMLFLLLFGWTLAAAQPQRVRIVQEDDAFTLTVDGTPFMINGMNWDYFPIGTNYTYSLWEQSDDLIRQALDREMTLLQDMGVNVLRQYTGIPARWIQYIYEEYGIFTMLNHSFGRYGLRLDGEDMPNTEYADPRVQELLRSEVEAMAESYRDTPGLLLYLLGNENNFGLFWGGAETEDVPVADRASTVRARAMYDLFNQAALIIQAIDPHHPVAICNGDLQFLDLIAAHCPDVDILGTNMYRGPSFGDAFQRVKTVLDRPILFTEFGADAFDALQQQEDQLSQAYYLVQNWQEIYENGAGAGGTGNAIGGFTFQFSDGWWKVGQTTNLSVHDRKATWANGGYENDYQEGKDNMNEEWFGICAKGKPDQSGLYPLYPRAAYYALQQAHQLAFTRAITRAEIREHFSHIQLKKALRRAKKKSKATNY